MPTRAAFDDRKSDGTSISILPVPELQYPVYRRLSNKLITISRHPCVHIYKFIHIIILCIGSCRIFGQSDEVRFFCSHPPHPISLSVHRLFIRRTFSYAYYNNAYCSKCIHIDMFFSLFRYSSSRIKIVKLLVLYKYIYILF